jgi:hypothetical protein
LFAEAPYRDRQSSRLLELLRLDWEENELVLLGEDEDDKLLGLD